MKPYQSYKDSGVLWFGEIPNHWKMYPIKHLLSERNERNDYGNTNYLSIVKDKGVILYSEKGNVGNKTSDRPENYKMVYVDDIVINSMNITIGSVGKSTHNGCLSSVYIVLKPNNTIDSSYYDYIFSDKSLQKSLKRISYGIMEIRESLNKIEFYVERLPFPTLPEQKQIVSFLDNKTQKIDELIEKTEKKIELLKEKRTSLINHCVTKGLNPNVEMKESGVEWIGEIPIHWGLIQLKYLSNKVGSGVTPRGGSDVYIDDGIPFLRSQNIHFQGLVLDDVVYISQEIHEQMSSSKVLPNDVLFNITGASIGRCFYTKPNSTEYNVNQHVCIIRPNEKILTKFLYYCLYSDVGQIQVLLNNTGSGKEGLNFQNIKSFVLPNVKKNEQHQIVEYLDEQTQKIDTTIEKETQRIELLKEYRQSLISEVVKGKIDVRDEVIV